MLLLMNVGFNDLIISMRIGSSQVLCAFLLTGLALFSSTKDHLIYFNREADSPKWHLMQLYIFLHTKSLLQ